MRAIMLAAGRGMRLHGDGHEEDPKSLLVFDGETLLCRHLRVLRGLGLDELVVVTGYRRERIEAELSACGAAGFARTLVNPQFERGALVSLRVARDVLRGGDPVLFMDADVLYDPAVLGRLMASPQENALVYDAAFEPGEDPVMVGLVDGRVVGFGKQVPGRFDAVGEWPGFLKLGAEAAGRLADAVEARVTAGELDSPYEPAMADVLVGEGAPALGVVDVSDLAWIEIDFPEDLARARAEVMPRLRSSRSAGRRAG